MQRPGTAVTAAARWLAGTLSLLLASCVSGQPDRGREMPSVEEVLTSTPERLWGDAGLGSVLDVDPRASWRSEAVALPSVLRQGGHLKMYFAGAERTGNPYLSRIQIGLAESTDGMHFRMANAGQPVLTPGPAGAFDSLGVSHPFVLEVPHPTGDGSELWMYYVGADGTQGANGVRVERVGLARSRDGVTWQRHLAPVVDSGSAGEADSSQAASPSVLRSGTGFHMWYGAYDGTHRIAYATSPDGVSWTKHGVVRGLRGPEAGELGPAVFFDGRQYLMFYNSVDPEAHEWKLFAATSDDGRHWSTAFGGRPVVGDAPDWTFAAAGRGRNSAVHVSQLVPTPAGWLVFYTGEDKASVQRIGVLQFHPR